MPPAHNSDYYELLRLPTAAEDNGDKAHETWTNQRSRIVAKNLKQVLFRVLVLLAIIYLGYRGLKPFVASSSSKSLRPCHSGELQREKLTSLPSHFTLPSGDKIPSVALGASPGLYDHDLRSAW